LYASLLLVYNHCSCKYKWTKLFTFNSCGICKFFNFTLNIS